MAKVGYIFKKEPYEDFNEDKNWMLQFGCVNVVEEQKEHEKLRPKWKQLLSSLGRGDELVVTKFSNAVRGSRELASLIELCRIKVVRIISVHDKIDTKNILFPDTKVSDVIEMFGSLPEECAALRNASSHIVQLQQDIIVSKKWNITNAEERAKMIVDMYKNGYSISEIHAISGFNSRSSVFRILNKYGVKLNRGRFSGPLGKRKNKKDNQENEENS